MNISEKRGVHSAGTSELFVPSFHTTHTSTYPPARTRAIVCEQLTALLATVTYY